MTAKRLQKIINRELARFDADSEPAIAFAEMDRLYPTWRRFAGVMGDEAENADPSKRASGYTKRCCTRPCWRG